MAARQIEIRSRVIRRTATGVRCEPVSVETMTEERFFEYGLDYLSPAQVEYEANFLAAFGGAERAADLLVVWMAAVAVSGDGGEQELWRHEWRGPAGDLLAEHELEGLYSRLSRGL